ncbi:MAG: cobalamin biosynthesis protein, partial [Sulfuritalea sp.]|nr:cobalamin biosynthesis protein [Sulfuritalea sp.]
LDWLPARITAASFAIVGDFEDAVYCWRTQARQWSDSAAGILLASGAGALGIRLGMPLSDSLGIDVRPELGLGDDADVDHLQGAIGLVWRALVLCLLLLALLTVAGWAGA